MPAFLFQLFGFLSFLTWEGAWAAPVGLQHPEANWLCVCTLNFRRTGAGEYCTLTLLTRQHCFFGILALEGELFLT